MNKGLTKVVADTNIYISAFVVGGVAEELLSLAKWERIDLYVSDAILSEVRDVLTRKFLWDSVAVHKAVDYILNDLAHTIRTTTKVRRVKRDPDDDRILECAVDARADYIITGDKDLLSLGKFRKITIVQPHVFLEISTRA